MESCWEAAQAYGKPSLESCERAVHARHHKHTQRGQTATVFHLSRCRCPSNSVTDPPRVSGSEKIASSAWLHCHPVMFPCLPCQPSSSSDSKWGAESLGQEPPVEHPLTQPSRLRLRGRLVQSLLPWSFRLSGSHPCCTTDHLTWCPGSRAEARYH